MVSFGRTRLLLLFVAALVLLAGERSASAAAGVKVFHSERDDGTPAGPARVHGPTLVHVYFENAGVAPAPGLACTPASGGSEVCQWAVRFTASGGLVISDVAWNGVPIAPVEDDEPTSPATERNGTGGSSVAGQWGSTKIATVAVTGIGAGGVPGELILETPAGFGFVDRNGEAGPVDTGTQVLARTAPLPWRGLSANQTQSCGIAGNGELHCWGTLAGAPPAGSYQEVDAASGAACALDADNAVVCWGGLVPPIGSPSYLQLAAGDGHICGLLPSLAVECFGDDSGPTSVEDTEPAGHF